MAAYESPRLRRLRSDLAALEKLKAESSVFDFQSTGRPPQHYTLTFHGRSLARDRGKVVYREHHEVEIKLGAGYPRTMPELRWLSPIYHPNISEIGMVCLGAYGTHWVPSLSLDELCVMLWDMARFQNYDIRSPYNREAAQWAANQTIYRFPIDPRPLRDSRAALGRIDSNPPTTLGSHPLASGQSICVLDLEIDLTVSGRTSKSTTSGPGPSPTPEASPRPEPREEVFFLD